jgi:hypothetical protein
MRGCGSFEAQEVIVRWIVARHGRFCRICVIPEVIASG